MEIHLKTWQTNLLTDFFTQIPIFPRQVLEQQVFLITYGDLAVGNGWYNSGKVEISAAIRHPRMVIERTLHECGHGIEEWLSQNQYPLYDCNIEYIADGFALAILYPDILFEPKLKKIRKIYQESLFSEGFPEIDTESLITKYVHHSEELIQKGRATHGIRVSKLLANLFEQQKNGFLRQYSTAFTS
jgi:hypothetical protein